MLHPERNIQAIKDKKLKVSVRWLGDPYLGLFMGSLCLITYLMHFFVRTKTHLNIPHLNITLGPIYL